jgi:hypothetical protein
MSSPTPQPDPKEDTEVRAYRDPLTRPVHKLCPMLSTGIALVQLRKKKMRRRRHKAVNNAQ